MPTLPNRMKKSINGSRSNTTPERVTFWFRAGYLDAMCKQSSNPPGGHANDAPYLEGYERGKQEREQWEKKASTAEIFQ
jgi:hypothetical protein